MHADRKQLLKELILDLHQGVTFDEVKARFQQTFGTITTEEIVQLEQALMQEEGITPKEVQKLRSVHAALFKGSIEDIHSTPAEKQLGHPVQTFKKENQAIGHLLNEDIRAHLERFEKEDNEDLRLKLLADLNLLMDIDKHYSRKEQLLFPYLEANGINGPSQVMWAVDDFIRQKLCSSSILLWAM
ncbi:DUF438 domain-containing protein [Halalkalibacterium halodurans]|uniref:DUF438 domain-containing protein n=1 Tax=Halalkalibacterium halodurans TaxID=86665 RepID=UPI002E1F85C8|nr:DUF438 domain-containing protein [Halalkalibacterium halodurans]MED4082822.1 DUF438 domain-containing protein [Halalkalibacterium halodurans]MED4083259.1 DUF438 domain-containing protein [Halalkalibacterium halodurans]MED4105212.1 DUF438 domain-containing protein [Halalkalibacterium halodurans]MED4110629.1 DUF438 domain-containing protein [Halalkalibacterium halodurans]